MEIKNKNTFIKIQRQRLSAVFPRLKGERKQMVITLVFTLIALTFFGLFAISPTIDTITKLQKQKTDAQFVNEKLLEKIQHLSKLQTQYPQVQQALPLLLAAIPASSQIALFTAEVQALAKKDSLLLTQLQTSPVDIDLQNQNTNGYNIFRFSVEAQGAYGDILQFINDLGTIDRIVTLDKISLNRNSLTSSMIQVDIEQGRAFFKQVAE